MLARSPQRLRWREKKRRQRAREHAHVASYPVDADGAVLDMLVRNNWLAEADAANRAKVGAAIAKMLHEAAHEEKFLSPGRHPAA